MLTGGRSLLVTGLSREEMATQAHCENCKNTWDFKRPGQHTGQPVGSGLLENMNREGLARLQTGQPSGRQTCPILKEIPDVRSCRAICACHVGGHWISKAKDSPVVEERQPPPKQVVQVKAAPKAKGPTFVPNGITEVEKTIDGTNKPEFSVEVDDNVDVIYLWSQPNFHTLPAIKQCESYSIYVRILQNGKLPEHGMFNVNGKPIAPQLVVVDGNPSPPPKSVSSGMGTPGLKRDSSGVQTRFVDNSYSFFVTIYLPGSHTLRANVGTWSKSFKIEARQLPLWKGMLPRELLMECGAPRQEGNLFTSIRTTL